MYEEDITGTGKSLTGSEIDGEVARFHDMASQLFGVTPRNDSGNRG